VIRLVAAPWVLTGQPAGGATPPGSSGGPALAAAIPDGAVALDGDRVLAVGPRAELEAHFGPAERLDAVLLPALVNAHLHLELSHLAGQVPGGGGLPAWIERFVGVRRATGEAGAVAAMARALASLEAAGVAAVGDVSNTLGSLAPLAAAGLGGTVFHEVFGAAPDRLAAARTSAAAARAVAPPGPGLRVVESPHAVYSTDPSGLVALLRGPPASLHLAEDPAEREFVTTGEGPFGALRARMGGPPGRPGWARSPVALAAPRLAPGWLLVHCVDLDDQDLALLAACGATVVLCPRSNDHISRARPPLLRLLGAGVPLAIGTDSLASSPSLAPLAELAQLRRDFPAVPASRLLPLAWNGAAVGAPGVGRLASGSAPGLLAVPLEGRQVADPFEHVLAQGDAAAPLRWLARHRPEVPAP
jgi:cytosine/adenosine deaminase-related metal-dependent hydrolase